MTNFLNNKFKRAFELTKMATQVGLKELTSSDLQSRIEQAKIITESLGQLRGAAMKAGQLLSLDLEDYFPPEAIKILSQLQNNVAEIKDIDIQKILIEKLTPANFQKITILNKSPFAAASMGQVYRAQLKIGPEQKTIPVVFKVLYPGLENSVNSDLNLLKKTMWAFCKITGRDMNLDPLFKEIETVLQNEMDYIQEKNAYLKFHELMKNRNWPYLKVTTPLVIPEFCSNHFLCLSYEEGPSLKEWLSNQTSIEERNNLALTLLDLYITEFFEWGFVQTDPNPGNFIVQNQTLVALDFGATKFYDISFRQSYVKLLRAIKSLDEKRIIEEVLSFKLIDPRESKESFDTLITLLKLGVQPFLNEAEFNFSDDQFLKENSKLSRELLAQLRFSPPPHQLIFLHRKLGGIYAILRKLQAKIDVNQFWDRIDKFDIDINKKQE